MQWEHTLFEVGVRQYGVVGRHQLPHLGLTIDQWWRARRSGRWEAMSPRVLRARGAPIDDALRAMAAVLDAGPCSALHGPSALAWFGAQRATSSRLHVVRPRGTRSDPSMLADVHRVRALAPDDVLTYRGIPASSPIRATWSEASRYGPPALHDLGIKRIGRIVDNLHLAGLLPHEVLHASVDRLRGRGRAGTTVMAAVAERRPIGSSPTESRLEDRLEEVLETHGCRGSLQRQRRVGGRRLIGRVDHLDLDLPVVIETNSLLHHTAVADREADEARYAELNEAGFTVAVAWEGDLYRFPRAVADAVREARRRAAVGECVVIHSPGCPWPPDPNRIIVGAGDPPLRG